MSWVFSGGTLLGITAACISAVVAIRSLRYRGKRMAMQFFLLEVGIAVWALLYALQLAQPTVAGQLFWQRLTFAAAGFIPATWLLFAFAYTGRTGWQSRDRAVAVFLPSVLWVVACLTNPVHGLVWTTGSLVTTPLGHVLTVAFGPGYAAFIIYAYAIVLAGQLVLAVYAAQIAPVYRKQVALLLLAAAFPFSTHLLFTVGESPVPHLDLTPFAFALTGVFLGLALFRFNLLQLVPVGREQAFNEAGDGLVVVNTDGEITDAIGVATAILDPTPEIGASIETVFPDRALDDLDGVVESIRHDGEHRVYQCRVSPLDAHHDEPVGQLLLLRDITEMYESRQRLSVTNRLLRHNVRNDMTVVLGHADLLESSLEGGDALHARRIRDTAQGFVESADKAKQIATLDEIFAGPGVTVDLVGRTRDVVEAERAAHPGADIRLTGPAELPLEGFVPEAYALALENLLENAIEHADDAPRVEVHLEGTPEAVRVEVRDSGPGIPEGERQAIGAETETQLDHSQGVGLWLAYWCVRKWGGELSFAIDDGTTVSFTIPRDGH